MSTSRITTECIAIVRKNSIGRGFEVGGIGLDDVSAWRDAAENVTRGRLDAVTFMREHREYQKVPAKITITFDPQQRVTLRFADEEA